MKGVATSISFTSLAISLIFAGTICHISICQEAPSELSGLTTDELFSIRDGEPLENNNKAIGQLLYRATKTSEENFATFALHTKDIALRDVVASPRDFRGYVFKFSGQVKSVNAFSDPNADDESSVPEFLLVQFETDEGTECLVAVPKSIGAVPQRWPMNTPIDEPAAFTGFFMSNHEIHADESKPETLKLDLIEPDLYPVFVSSAIQWFPKFSTNRSWLVTPSEIFLAERSVDITKLDVVRKNINGPLKHELKPSFYQILSACRELDAKELPKEKLDFKQCLIKPKQSLACAITVKGRVRRVEKVEITDPTTMESFGADHYYQLQLFSRLEDHRIAIQQGGSDKQDSPAPPVVHQNRYPITVCVGKLPVDAANVETKIVNRQVAVTGFFFKLWNYESMQAGPDGRKTIQVVPLILGTTPCLADDEVSGFGFWPYLMFVIGFAGFAVLLWFFGPVDRKARLQFESKTRDLPETIEIPESPKSLQD